MRKSLPMPFARTMCNCEMCSYYCKIMPGYLIPADLPRLMPEGAKMEDWAKSNLRASDGALVVKNGRQIWIRTLVPAHKEDGSCINLQADGSCGVHEVSPFGCAFFDSHMTDPEHATRSGWGLQLIYADWQVGGPYSMVWNMLNTLGLRSRPKDAIAKDKRQAAMGFFISELTKRITERA